MAKFDKMYAEALGKKIREHAYCEGEEVSVIVIRSTVDHTFGAYVDCCDKYHLICTDESVDVYLAICDSAMDDKPREAMWEMLTSEAASHGFKKTLPNLSAVSDDDLLAELERRGLV